MVSVLNLVIGDHWVNGAASHRSRLEMLNLSQNRLNKIEGLKTLGGLIALNLGTQGVRGFCGIRCPRCPSHSYRWAVGNQRAPWLNFSWNDTFSGTDVIGSTL